MKKDFSHKRSLLVSISPRFWQNEPQESSSNRPTLFSEKVHLENPGTEKMDSYIFIEHKFILATLRGKRRSQTNKHPAMDQKCLSQVLISGWNCLLSHLRQPNTLLWTRKWLKLFVVLEIVNLHISHGRQKLKRPLYPVQMSILQWNYLHICISASSYCIFTPTGCHPV